MTGQQRYPEVHKNGRMVVHRLVKDVKGGEH